MEDCVWNKFNNDKEQCFVSTTYKMKIVINNINLPLIITFQGFSSALMSSINLDTIDVIKLNEISYYMNNTFSKNENYNYIYVCDIYQIWCSLNFDYIFKSLKNIINHFLPNKIICVGQSAGGYQSILFGNLLNVHKIISFVPQINIFTTNMNKFRYELIEKNDLLKFKYKNLNVLQPFKTLTKIYICNGTNDIKHLEHLDKSDKNLIISKVSNNNTHDIVDEMGKEQYIRLIFDELCAD